jgi:hypothetical protein
VREGDLLPLSFTAPVRIPEGTRNRLVGEEKRTTKFPSIDEQSDIPSISLTEDSARESRYVTAAELPDLDDFFRRRTEMEQRRSQAVSPSMVGKPPSRLASPAKDDEF